MAGSRPRFDRAEQRGLGMRFAHGEMTQADLAGGSA
jgi:hypothetical protein